MSRKNKPYWHDRQEKKYLAGEKKVNTYYRDLKKSFEQAKREIDQVIHDFVMRYGVENGSPSYAAALRKLNKTEIGELEAFIDKVRANMGKYNLEINNMSIKARITRYQALQKQIDALLQQLYGIEYQYKGEELLKEVYSDAYYRTWFNIDQYHGFHFEFAQINAKTVEELIKYPFNGADFSTRIWRQKEDMLQRLNESITTMLIQGRNPKTLAGEMSKTFGTKEYEAYRLLHTEGSFIMEQGTLAGYKEDGVEKYQILATLDTRTSEICRDEDGKVYDIDKVVTGKNYPPYHPFCRTTTVPYYEDEDLSEETRVARDYETGKTYDVPADMTYEQWHDKYVTGKTKREYQNLIGLRTANDITVTGVSEHAIDRAIQRKTSAEQAKEGLINPLKIGKIKTDNMGRRSQKFIGEKATASINPDTGIIIQVNPTSSDYVRRLKKRRG